MTKSQIENTFTYHSPSPSQIGRYLVLREAGKDLAMLIFESCPPSREKSIAMTKVQEAIQMANAAIAINEEQG